MNGEDWTNVGMTEAAKAHGVDLHPVEAEYRAIQARPVGNVQSYVEQEEKVEQPDTGALKPAQIRALKMFAISGSVVTGWVGFLGVCASGAMNTVFQVVACGGVLVAMLSGLRGGSNLKEILTSSKKEYHEHHHYHQNNNFGNGGANQNNGK